MCTEFKIKISKANKAVLSGQIISYWQTGLFREDNLCSASACQLSVITLSIHETLKQIGNCPVLMAAGKVVSTPGFLSYAEREPGTWAHTVCACVKIPRNPGNLDITVKYHVYYSVSRM